ncbi:hypothetical protein B0J13DRAFT_611588 [Dactylonectria estremocensis]|uniref:Uncharacterized protein n=1 Tax=Dactylonectria estremocensis TaxID=1079267 RepID=A0A9P9IR19_9HYPO|nr:hypothetical protein B0J13DRAFT_611588 [Dactylonectria estremocensis]
MLFYSPSNSNFLDFNRYLVSLLQSGARLQHRHQAALSVSKNGRAHLRTQLQAPTITVKPLPLNLLSFTGVRKAAQTVNSWHDVPQIDVLVNNAGILAVLCLATEDGLESQFRTNHLSHFLSTSLMIDKILVSEAPRVVFVSSGVNRTGNIRWSDYNFNDDKHYQRWLGYGQSKTANVLTALALAEKLGSRGILSFAMCPGVSYTNLESHDIHDPASFSAYLTELTNCWIGPSCGGIDLNFQKPPIHQCPSLSQMTRKPLLRKEGAGGILDQDNHHLWAPSSH